MIQLLREKVRTASGNRTWVNAREQLEARMLCFLTDCLLFVVALHVSTLSVIGYVDPDTFLALQRDRLFCTALFVGASLAAGAHRSLRLTDRFDAVYYMLVALAITGLGHALFAGWAPPGVRAISRRELMASIIIAVPLLATWRFFAARFLATHFESFQRFYVVFGEERAGKRIAKTIRQDTAFGADARYFGYAALKRRFSSSSERPPRFQEEAIMVMGHAQQDEFSDAIELCKQHCARTFLYPNRHDAIFFQRHNLQAVAGIPVIEISNLYRLSSYPYVKRLLDILCAATVLIAASPIMVATAIAVKLTSRGPVFFLQERLGRDGRLFDIIKFRSMRPKAEPNGNPVRATQDDPRITPVGRTIRKYKIDEMPQLINVLRGDMSLVGPRPLWKTFFDEDPSALMWERRLAIRPGVTSLAHVLSSSHFAPSDLLRYDLVYIGSMSFLTDLRILLATIRIVLSGKGGQ